MRSLILASLVALCIGGCSIEKDERAQVIDSIESAVKLPDGALRLDQYERYYTSRDGFILAVYITHSDYHRKAVLAACQSMNEKGFPCPLDDGKLRLVNAGQSRWVENPLEIPGMSGGGCSQVTILYSPERQEFMRVECNGPY